MKYFLALCSLIFSLSVQAGSVEVEGFELVKSQRVNVREYVITYRLTVKSTDSDIQNLTAQVSSSDPSVEVLDADLEFGDIDSGGLMTSTDTFSIQKDRTAKFDLNTLSFDFNFE